MSKRRGTTSSRSSGTSRSRTRSCSHEAAMSSSSSTRSRVIRGAATTAVRRVPFTEDLGGDRASMALDPVAAERALEAGRQAGYEQGYAAGLAAAAASVAQGDARRQADVDRAVSALTSAAIAFHQRQAEALA